MVLDPALYDAVRGYVSPDENEEDAREAVRALVEESDAQIEALLDEGLILFGRYPPQQRLAGYRAATLPEDLPWVTEPDYWDFRRESGHRLRAELLLEERLLLTPEEQAAMPPIPKLWPLLLSCRELCFKKVSRDFRQLLRAEERETGRAG